MITAVDTNILLDVFGADERFGSRSAEVLRRAIAAGSVIACKAVWADVGGSFPSAQDAWDGMRELGVGHSAMSEAAALAAGSAWKAYRSRGGRSERVITDFLIGANADAQADRLLTRDRGFYRTYFAALRLVEPAVASR